MRLFRISLAFFLVLSLCAAPPSQAGSLLTGRVARVSDGDTLWLEIPGRFEWLQVRLYGIDAPESEWPEVWPAQPFSAAAKKFVREQTAGKPVSVQVRDIDTYGRVVGELFINGGSLNRRLLQRGLAWWNRKYAPDDPNFMHPEQEARAAGLGLWSQADPVPPWEHRRRYRQSKQ